MKKYLILGMLCLMATQARVIGRSGSSSMHQAIQRAQIDRIRRRRARSREYNYQEQYQTKEKVTQDKKKKQRTRPQKRKHNNFR